MRRRILAHLIVALAAAVQLTGAALWAQTNDEINGHIQFNFSSPGARSLAMGGAFHAIADDATAAFTNPAGLTVLSRPEVSFEIRSWSFENRYVDGGHANGPATNYGYDTVDGVQEGTATSDAIGPSFVSFVYARDRWALSLYRHELVNFNAEIRTRGAYISAGDQLYRLFPVRASMDLYISNYGLTGAVRVGKALSLGLTVASYNMDMDSLTRRQDICIDRLGADCLDPPLGAEKGQFWGEPDYGDDHVVNYQRQTGSDTGLGVNLGLLLRLGEKASLGLAYRMGPEFSLEAGNYSGTNQPPPDRVFTLREATFKVPDVFALGFALRPTDTLTLALDYSLVTYSDLTANMINVFFEDDRDMSNYKVDDANEIRFGLEYVIVTSMPIALRGGVWFDPDHKIRYDGTADIAAQVLWRGGEDTIHYTAGVGLVVSEKIQIDSAVDFSDAGTSASISAVHRF